MHECLDTPRKEAVVEEVVFLDGERGERPFQIAGTIVPHAMAQRQILRARGRANRVGLDEAEPVERALEGRGCEKAPRDGEAAQIVDRDDGFPFRWRHYTMTPVMCT